MSTFSALPRVPSTDPSICVFDGFRIAIAKKISDALPQLTVEQVYTGVDYGKKGTDFTVALPRFRLKEKPDILADTIVKAFAADDLIETVNASPPFIHFQLNTATATREVLGQVHKLTHETKSDKPEYGTNSTGEGRKVIIEYSSPNIAKAFHVGHLRSTIIGQFLVNVYRASGWNVQAFNYLGDWGTQFGLIAVGYEKYGSDEKLRENAIMHLYEIYVKISAEAEANPEVRVEAQKWFKRMEDGDEEALKNWRIWREMSVKKYAEEYAGLNVRFDVYTGESEVKQEYQDRSYAQLEEKGLIFDKEGAKRINLDKWKLETPVVRKKDGTSMYLTRDIAGAIQRYETYHFDKMIYVVASQQDQHLKQFFKVLDLLDYPWAKTLEHVNYGLVQGMSTRKGTAVFLSDIIREASTIMHEQMRRNEAKYAAIEDPEHTAREVGITAIKIQDMAAKRINNYPFSWDRMTSFEGDTGPYLQYAHVRLASMERKNPNLVPLPPPNEIKTELLSERNAREIIMLIGSYPDVVKVAQKTHEPSGVVTFAFRLSHSISSAWEVLSVKAEADQDKARARLWLFTSARDVLAAAMRLLSIEPLQHM